VKYRISGYALLVCACVTFLVPTRLRTAESGSFREITKEQIEAVEKGLKYLSRTQNRDGSWDSGNYRMNPGITALACLAFMAGGSVSEGGPYRKEVEKGLHYILKCQDANGLIHTFREPNPMYGHGYSALFMAEIYGMTGDRNVKPYLKKAVDVIIKAQKKDGGWRYTPSPRGMSDISVTVVQLMALRAARNAGIGIEYSIIKKAVDYIINSVCSDGGFSYTLQNKRSGFARTAAGVTSLYIAGKYEGDEIEGGLRYLLESREDSGYMHWYYYGNYYAAQAMFQAGGEYWTEWFPWIREELLKNQAGDGSWKQHSSAGPVFATAMSVMILEIPYRYLPIFQR